jgi:hypothetical protein
LDPGDSVSSRQTVGSVVGAVMFAAGAVMCAGAVMLVGAKRCWKRRLAVLEPGVGGVGTVPVGWQCWNRVVL